MFKNKIFQKTVEEAVSKQKSFFYLKSLQIKTDYTQYRTYFRNFHPKFFDVDRSLNKYIREVRDFKNLPIRTADPLYYDHDLEEVTGGMPELIKLLKKTNALGNMSSSVISPYKVMNLLYNIAYKEYNEKDFYQQLEKTINTSNLKLDNLHPRYVYGFLYASYKTGLGRPENIYFFENHLETISDSLRTTWIISLIKEYTSSILYDAEKFKRILDLCFVDNLLVNWNKEVKHNTKNISILIESLKSKNILNEIIWGRFIEDCKEKTVSKVKPPLLIYYDSNLNNLDYIVNNPESSFYQSKEVLELIDNMKALNNGFDDNYIYNEKLMRFNTFDEMVARKHEITPKTHIGITFEEEEVEEVVETIKQVKLFDTQVIRNEMKQRLEKGDHILVVKSSLYDKYPQYENEIEDFALELIEIFNKLQLEKYIKDGKLDQLFEKKSDPKAGASSSPASTDAKGDSKAEGKQKKKK